MALACLGVTLLTLSLALVVLLAGVAEWWFDQVSPWAFTDALIVLWLWLWVWVCVAGQFWRKFEREKPKGGARQKPGEARWSQLPKVKLLKYRQEA